MSLHHSDPGWWVFVPGQLDAWHRLSGPYQSQQAAKDYAAQFCVIWRVRYVG